MCEYPETGVDDLVLPGFRKCKKFLIHISYYILLAIFEKTVFPDTEDFIWPQRKNGEVVFLQQRSRVKIERKLYNGCASPVCRPEGAPEYEENENIQVKSTKGADMGYFYFARHGQTVWNVENKICGATDIALTEKGHEQAKELGRKILDEGIHIDEIIFSPLMRAADTAGHISDITGVPMRVEPELKEQNFGKYESTPRDGEEFRKAKMCFAQSYEGGESMIRFCQRIYNLLDRIKEESDEKVYLLVAHNGVARAVQSYFTDMSNEEFAKFGIKNCELKKYEF